MVKFFYSSPNQSLATFMQLVLFISGFISPVHFYVVNAQLSVPFNAQLNHHDYHASDHSHDKGLRIR